MKYPGIDFGAKRVGLAVSDDTGEDGFRGFENLLNQNYGLLDNYLTIEYRLVYNVVVYDK